MKIIKPYFEFEPIDREKILKNIEKAGRTCYKSEDKITEDSASKFVKSVIKRGHESILEHEKLTCRIICDRGISHELVRHRIANFSQESSRYCNYANDKFGKELTFIDPSAAFGWDPVTTRVYAIWEDSMQQAEKNYMELIEYGAKPQEARSILPNSIKTEIVITMNMRSWRHFFNFIK
jgi:thymidylate synthase (FAD)